MPPRKQPKGQATEELLRSYFVDLGYFAVRDIAFSFQRYDVTDVDLWLYLRPSPITRQRIIVDVKNKRTPQAIERIFWTRGLQSALGVDGSIVATTDKRPAVREFGLDNQVTVLDGVFLSKLGVHATTRGKRLTEEQFKLAIEADALAKMRGDWPTKVKMSKARLLTHLDFAGCNTWLADVAYFAEQALVDPQRRISALRLVYLNIAFFLVALDFILKDLSFIDQTARATQLKEGFIHGNMGRRGLDEILSQAVRLMDAYLPQGRDWGETLRDRVRQSFEDVPADVLKDYFARGEVARGLFTSARAFEEQAYLRETSPPSRLSSDLKAIVGVMLDFCQIERRSFFEVF